MIVVGISMFVSISALVVSAFILGLETGKNNK